MKIRDIITKISNDTSIHIYRKHYPQTDVINNEAEEISLWHGLAEDCPIKQGELEFAYVDTKMHCNISAGISIGVIK